MSALVRWCGAIVDTLWLSVLWLLGCATVVGIPAATVALVDTVRQIQAGRAPVIARAYWAAVRRHGGVATRLGWIWIAIGVVLAVDMLIVMRLGPDWVVAGGVVGLLLLGYVAVSAFMPCVVLGRDGHGVGELLRLAVGVAVVRPAATLQVVLALGVGAFGVAVAPFLVAVVPALVAHAAAFTWGWRIAPALAGTTTASPIRAVGSPEA